jgi:hypothetical protein
VLELMTHPHFTTNPLGSIDSVVSYVEVGLSDIPKHCGRGKGNWGDMISSGKGGFLSRETIRLRRFHKGLRGKNNVWCWCWNQKSVDLFFSDINCISK